MPKYKNYEKWTRAVSVDLANGDVLTLHYCPARYSNKFMREAATTGEGGRTNQEFLYHMLGGELPTDPDKEKAKGKGKPSEPLAGSWDWLGEDDQPLPITLEFLAEGVYLDDQAAMVKAILGDIFPNAPKRAQETETKETPEGESTSPGSSPSPSPISPSTSGPT